MFEYEVLKLIGYWAYPSGTKLLPNQIAFLEPLEELSINV
jgi:hypothetical protein